MTNTLTHRDARAILGGRCFGFALDTDPVFVPTTVLKRLSQGGVLYHVPQGSRSVPNGYDTKVFEGNAAQVLIPGSWHVPRHKGAPLSQQQSGLGKLSILSPYEVAVISEHLDVLKGCRVRTNMNCGFNTLTGRSLYYILRRTPCGGLQCEHQYETYVASNLGVVIGYRVEVP